MPNYPQSTQNILLAERLGIYVPRALSTLPQGTTTTIYTVSGGRVLVTALMGTVTTLLGAVGNMNYLAHAAVGTDLALCAVAAAGTAELGSHFVAPAAVGTALILTTAPGALLVQCNWMLESGTTILWQLSGSSTGAMSHALWYLPIDAGASVAAS
jgi:hypothetical protein